MPDKIAKSLNYAAKQFLTGVRLVFGDPEQCKCAGYIHSYDAAVDAAELCRKAEHSHALPFDCEPCNGTGEHECFCGDAHECAECDGTGFEEGGSGTVSVKKILECTFFQGLIPDAVREAIINAD